MLDASSFTCLFWYTLLSFSAPFQWAVWTDKCLGHPPVPRIVAPRFCRNSNRTRCGGTALWCKLFYCYCPFLGSFRMLCHPYSVVKGSIVWLSTGIAERSQTAQIFYMFICSRVSCLLLYKNLTLLRRTTAMSGLSWVAEPVNLLHVLY